MLDPRIMSAHSCALWAGSIKGTPSGAYIFRPNGQYAPTSPISEETVTGPLVSELRKVGSTPAMPFLHTHASAALLSVPLAVGCAAAGSFGWSTSRVVLSR